MAAWLGLVPRELSTGGKTKLFAISKRRSSYLRRLLVQGSRSCVQQLDRGGDRLGSRNNSLQNRMTQNRVVVALAAKIPRITRVVITKPGASCARRLPAVS
jgi:transposase